VIALISGRVAVRRTDHVVVDCQGVGYRLAVSSNTLRRVPAVDGHVTLHTHLVVRDDALSLYGFAGEEERELFLMLLGVQSVGPKVALAVLSGGPPSELLSAIAAGDSARFQAVPGIGKRTAERIIVELREKVGAALPETAIRVTRSDDPRAVAREGLLGLGYSAAEVDAMLDRAEGERAEDLIADALRSGMTRAAAIQASPDGERRPESARTRR
jgi:Holliday junction DNA helicase RuvA